MTTRMRTCGAMAIVAGVVYLPAVASGFLFPEGPAGPGHDLHWLSHSATGAASVFVLAALPGIWHAWRGSSGLAANAGRTGVSIIGLAAAFDVAQGLLVGLSVPLGGGEGSPLWNTGHNLAAGSNLLLPAMLLVGFSAWRSRTLPRSATIALLSSLALAAVMAPLLDRLVGDGGVAVLTIVAGASVAWITWGLDLRRRPGQDLTPTNRQRADACLL